MLLRLCRLYLACCWRCRHVTARRGGSPDAGLLLHGGYNTVMYGLRLARLFSHLPMIGSFWPTMLCTLLGSSHAQRWRQCTPALNLSSLSRLSIFTPPSRAAAMVAPCSPPSCCCNSLCPPTISLTFASPFPPPLHPGSTAACVAAARGSGPWVVGERGMRDVQAVAVSVETVPSAWCSRGTGTLHSTVDART